VTPESTSLDALGWSSFCSSTDDDARNDALADRFPARVTAQQRGQLQVHFEHGRRLALVRGSLLDDLPVVGDWVGLRALGDPTDPDGQVLIETRLPRHTVLARRRVGGGRAQTVAANVDCVAVVTSPDRDFRPRRIERYRAVAEGAGCAVRVLISKSDTLDPDALPPAIRDWADATRDDWQCVSALTGEGVDALRAWIGGRTVAFLGSSGVGKSSLVNALLGEAVQDTADVSEASGRGRHTTTTRDLLVLPGELGGGCVIDTPGMREIGLSADANPDAVFDDIAALASGCAYRDCQHVSEPGCAVLAAVDAGALSEGRLASYHKLGRELAWERRRSNKRAQREAHREWARMMKSVKRMKKDRGY
jgi:ribosome biogenesis GTPase